MLIQQYLDRATGKIKIYTLENYKRAPAQQPYETISLLETIDNHIGIRVFLMVLWHLLANPNWASCAAPALNQSHYSKQAFLANNKSVLLSISVISYHSDIGFTSILSIQDSNMRF